MKPAARARRVTGVLLCVLPVVLLLAVATGPVHISSWHALAWLAGRHTAFTPEEAAILWTLRLPRVLAAACTGAALAGAGVVFQGLFRNALADPYVIGSSSGSLAGAAVAIFLLPETFSYAGFESVSLCAFAGGFAAVGLVSLLGATRGNGATTTLLLAGFAVGTMLNAGTYLVEEISGDANGMRALAAWLQGAVAVASWRQLSVAGTFLGVGLLLAQRFAGRLDTLALGDEYAAQVGMDVRRTRFAIIAVGTLLTVVAVTLGGLISFVGLIVPHLLRMLLGPNHARLLLASVLGGAMFLVVADTAARTLFAPTEVPAGILMALAGGPFFLYMLYRDGGKYTL